MCITQRKIVSNIIQCIYIYICRLVCVRLIFDGTPQIIVQRYEIAAERWPNDIRSAADNVIFKNMAQNVECSFGCMARSAVLLKLNGANILLLNFCEQNFIQHGPITIAIDCNGLFLLIFEENWHNYASGPKSAPNSDSFWVAFQCMRAGFLCPKYDNFACLHTRQDQSEFHWKYDFFILKSTSSVSRSQAHLAKRKRIGWSINFNSWTNWTLYDVIPRSLCKIHLNGVSEWCVAVV